MAGLLELFTHRLQTGVHYVGCTLQMRTVGVVYTHTHTHTSQFVYSGLLYTAILFDMLDYWDKMLVGINGRRHRLSIHSHHHHQHHWLTTHVIISMISLKYWVCYPCVL